MSEHVVQPLLRWVGGKRKLVARLRSLLPVGVRKRTYREPFLGAGALFFSLLPKRSFLSDANAELIACYRAVRDRADLLSRYLAAHGRSSSERHYYTVRRSYNSGAWSVAQAARFIYLNNTCFNGVFRVNKHGEFNVPYGWKEPPLLPTSARLKEVSRALQNAQVRTIGFERALDHANRGDFVYLDPPYPPLNGTAYFTHYTQGRFSASDQQRLADCVSALDREGCLFMMSNADTPLIRSLYKRFNIVELPVIRYVTCRAVKCRVQELVVLNYEVRHGDERLGSGKDRN